MDGGPLLRPIRCAPLVVPHTDDAAIPAGVGQVGPLINSGAKLR